MVLIPKFRHELKYICSGAELRNLEVRLRGLMQPDPHVVNGKYLIRSIYFDDFYQSRVLANEAGLSIREKWRIRAYNCSDAKITLECKRKEHGMILKTSCPLTREQYEAIVFGRYGVIRKQDGSKSNSSFDRYTDISNQKKGDNSQLDIDISSDNPPLLNKFLYEQKTMLLKPSVIVQYLREPWVYALGNVRVTFDLDIASSDDFEKFFDEDLPVRPVLQTGMHLLEVKYDEYIPDTIYRSVQMTNMRMETFSKYCLCRQYNMKGITAL